MITVFLIAFGIWLSVLTLWVIFMTSILHALSKAELARQGFTESAITAMNELLETTEEGKTSDANDQSV